MGGVPGVHVNRATSMLIVIAGTASGVRAQPTPTPAPAPTTPAPAAEPTAAELAEIEAALGSDAKDAAAGAPARATSSSVLSSFNPDLSFVLDVAAAWFSRDENLQTGGHDPMENGFHLQQLEMSIGKAVDPYFRFD